MCASRNHNFYWMMKRFKKARMSVSNFVSGSDSGIFTNTTEELQTDAIELRFKAMLERHERQIGGHKLLGLDAEHLSGGNGVSPDKFNKSNNHTKGRRSKIASHYSRSEKERMLLFDTMQYGTTFVGCCYLLSSITTTYIENAHRNSDGKNKLLNTAVVIFNVILATLIVVATCCIIFTFHYAKYSKTILKLLMSLGRFWRIIFLLFLRLIFGIIATIYGAPFSTLLDGIALLILGSALIFQDILLIRYSRKILRIWVVSFTCVMLYTWIQSLINKGLDDVTNPSIFNLRYNTYIRTIYSSLFGIMFDGLLVTLRDTGRKQFVWIIKRKFRSDLFKEEKTQQNVEELDKKRHAYNSRQTAVIFSSILVAVFYMLGLDSNNGVNSSGGAQYASVILYYCSFIILLVSVMSLYQNNFSFGAFKLLIRERHMFMACLYCISHLVLNLYMYWPHRLGGWPSEIRDANQTVIQEGYGNFTDSKKILNIVQSILFLGHVLTFLSMDSLIIKSPLLVIVIATHGGLSTLQSALGASFIRKDCYIVPGLTVTQCSIEVSIYTSLCFLFCASFYTAIKE
jgi:hypothetical protein